jgi:hypothetical protein
MVLGSDVRDGQEQMQVVLPKNLEPDLRLLILVMSRTIFGWLLTLPMWQPVTRGVLVATQHKGTVFIRYL